MINAAIFASGEDTNAENIIKYFANDTRIKIKLVFTNNENAGVVAREEKHKKNVQIISKDSLNNYADQLIDFLQTEKIDLIILAGFLLKIPEAFVKAFPNKMRGQKRVWARGVGFSRSFSTGRRCACLWTICNTCFQVFPGLKAA